MEDSLTLSICRYRRHTWRFIHVENNQNSNLHHKVSDKRTFVFTSRVDQPPSFVSSAVRLTDDGHQVPFGQVQVQVPAAHHSPRHLVDLPGTVFVC